MPDDRFGDLDPTGRRGVRGRGEPREQDDDRSAAERLAELDERGAPGEDPQAPPPARTGSPYAWVIAVAGLVLLATAAITTLGGAPAPERPEAGGRLPEFAAPSATGESDADANVRQREGGSEQEAAVPACEVDVEDVVNICRLREWPVVLTFVVPGCEDALDRVEAVRGEFPGVNFVGVIGGESREGVADLLAEHEWGFPVALDPDRAVSTLYGVVDCPTTVTAEAGGEVAATRNGAMTEEELRAVVRDVAARHGSS